MWQRCSCTRELASLVTEFMDGDWQTWIVLGIVALAAVCMARRFLGKSGRSCGGGCDCPGKTITPKREE
jgi:hypothetical protein